MDYVVGIIWDEDFENCVLIRKNRPDWQAGKMNGVGGKIENNEIPLSAMIRECKEESGLDIQYWFELGSKNVNDGILYYFTANSNLGDIQSMTDEVVLVIPRDNIKDFELVDGLTQILDKSIEFWT